MKRIKKIGMILKDTSGETMIEVLVAFTLLSIMMVVFSQGLASAANSEANAKNSRDSADKTMLKLQQKLSSDTPNTTDTSNNINVKQGTSLNAGTGSITAYTYTVDGNVYIVYKTGT